MPVVGNGVLARINGDRLKYYINVASAPDSGRSAPKGAGSIWAVCRKAPGRPSVSAAMASADPAVVVVTDGGRPLH